MRLRAPSVGLVVMSYGLDGIAGCAVAVGIHGGGMTMRGEELRDLAIQAEFDRLEDRLEDERRFGPPRCNAADDVELVPTFDENGMWTGYRYKDKEDYEIEVVII